MSMLHGAACWRQCGSFAAKLRKLDDGKVMKIVHWCRMQVSSHRSRGVVDDMN